SALPQFGSAAIGPLIERLDSPQRATGESALTALTTIGPSAVPQLAASLHSGSAARKIAAIKLLRSLGPSSAPAVPDIAALLDDPLVGTTGRLFRAGRRRRRSRRRGHEDSHRHRPAPPARCHPRTGRGAQRSAHRPRA